MNFTEFSLHEDLLKGITAAGYVTCTPVQEQVLKTSLQGDDLYVQSKTGTGKTAAYIIPIIQELLTRPESSGKKALILVPTRELAVQVETEAKKLLVGTKLLAFSFYGGVGYDKQVAALKKGVDFIIGTPGRIIDLQQGKQMDLSAVNFLVIDEADRMFDMGFYPDLRTLLKVLPKAEERQTLLFSATLNTYIKNLAWEYTRNAKEITIESEHLTVDLIHQELIHVSSDEKIKLLLGILRKENPESVLIFCNTKKGCEILGKRLCLNGIKTEYIIGDMQQSKRLKVLEDFRAGKVSVLVATDVAARGIDVTDLKMVVNYDLPNECENYVHRIGRTARAGKSGKAYTFCSERDVYDLPPIERYLGYSIPSAVCNAELLSEDKSAGVYIKTDSYEDSFHGEKNPRYSKESSAASYKARTHNSSYKRSDNKSHSNYNRPNGPNKTSSANPNRKYDSDKKTFTNATIEDLSKLSFEERLAIYKKKYAESSNVSAKKKTTNRSSSDKNQNYTNKKYNKDSRAKFDNRVNKNKNYNNSKKTSAQSFAKKDTSSQTKVAPTKTGLFSKLKKLFGRKDK